jgi:hypothetical protein
MTTTTGEPMSDSDTTAFSNEPGDIVPAPEAYAIARVIGSPEGMVLIDIADGDGPALIERDQLAELAGAINMTTASMMVLRSQLRQAAQNEEALIGVATQAQGQTGELEALLAKANQLLIDSRKIADGLAQAMMALSDDVKDYAFDAHGMGPIHNGQNAWDRAKAAIDAYAQGPWE